MVPQARFASGPMSRVFLILSLSMGVALGATPQDEAKARFTAELRDATSPTGRRLQKNELILYFVGC